MIHECLHHATHEICLVWDFMAYLWVDSSSLRGTKSLLHAKSNCRYRRIADRLKHTCCNTVRYIGTKTHNDYGAGSGQIWLDNVQCNGTERDIDDCTHTAWGVHSCEHHDDVAILCNTGRTVAKQAGNYLLTHVNDRHRHAPIRIF